jgi:hypothetical protein
MSGHAKLDSANLQKIKVNISRRSGPYPDRPESSKDITVKLVDHHELLVWKKVFPGGSFEKGLHGEYLMVTATAIIISISGLLVLVSWSQSLPQSFILFSSLPGSGTIVGFVLRREGARSIRRIRRV